MATERGWPSALEVDGRIETVRADPSLWPSSGDYCRACLMAGIAHCGEPTRQEEVGGCGQRVPYAPTPQSTEGQAR